jgi:hypothetical protein
MNFQPPLLCAGIGESKKNSLFLASSAKFLILRLPKVTRYNILVVFLDFPKIEKYKKNLFNPS